MMSVPARLGLVVRRCTGQIKIRFDDCRLGEQHLGRLRLICGRCRPRLCDVDLLWLGSTPELGLVRPMVEWLRTTLGRSRAIFIGFDQAWVRCGPAFGRCWSNQAWFCRHRTPYLYNTAVSCIKPSMASNDLQRKAFRNHRVCKGAKWLMLCSRC